MASLFTQREITVNTVLEKMYSRNLSELTLDKSIKNDYRGIYMWFSTDGRTKFQTFVRKSSLTPVETKRVYNDLLNTTNEMHRYFTLTQPLHLHVSVYTTILRVVYTETYRCSD
jgi:hypothetical protein